MNDSEKRQKIEAIIQNEQLDGLVLGDPYHVQYATGVHIPAAHAQRDLVMFAVFMADKEPLLLVPHGWHAVASKLCYFPNVVAYGVKGVPLATAVSTLSNWCQPANRIGLDEAALPVAHHRQLTAAFAKHNITFVDITPQLAQARAVKTAAELHLLKSIAYKIDHVINGHFHHLSADRPRTASTISESLRIHSLERDIPIEGYHAGGRAVLGKSLGQFWAYAPKYGFADAEMTQEYDAIIAHMVNNEAGYWSNSVRIAISHDEMSVEQEAAYGQLVRVRELLLAGLKNGRLCADIYRETIAAAKEAGLQLVKNLPLGFCVGVSPMEGPYLAPGESQTVANSMVFVLDPVIKHDGLFYRSRDTVVVTENGAEIVNWYKDWREPYLAILEL